MKTLIRWAIGNTAAVNTLVVGVIVVGVVSLFSLRRETFPAFELEIVYVTVPYPGADPDEVETAICQKIESAVSSISDIKEITSVAGESAGSVVIELDPDAEVQERLNEIRSAVSRISTFPELAEDPEVRQIIFREVAMHLAVLGPQDHLSDGPRSDEEMSLTERRNQRRRAKEAQLRLRDVAESVRRDLLQLDTISHVEIQGARDYQIDIEVPEAVLRRYGLTLRDVAGAVRRENLDLPGGLLRNPSQNVMLKGVNKEVSGAQIAEIPLITDAQGVVLTIGDVASVQDAFADVSSQTRINGRPALVLRVERTSDEDLIEVTDAVKKFAATYELPIGYELLPWDDRSVEVRERIDMLLDNGLQGLVLVFIALSLFLNLRLAFWVGIGIPIALLGTCIALLAGGQTLNMLSMFGFLMVMGILVDDAIVISENVHVHRGMGKSPYQAAIDGASEVAVSVAASVATTIIAFLPLLFVAGVMGKFISVLPLAVIACLIISLVETTTTLPMHLAHEPDPRDPPVWRRLLRIRGRMPFLARWSIGLPLIVLAGLIALAKAIFSPIAWILQRLNPLFSHSLDWLIENIYAPILRRVVRNPGLVICASLALLLITVGLVAGGFIRRQFFPDLDVPVIQATVTFPDGTPESVTNAAVAELARALEEINQHYTSDGIEPVKVVQESMGYSSSQGSQGFQFQSTGSHLGRVKAELIGSSFRDVKSQTLVNAWREATPEIPGALSVVFASPAFGPAARKIEFKLLADREDEEQLERAVEEAKTLLGAYPGVFDVNDDSLPGKVELHIELKPSAVALGVQTADLYETVRAAYFGEEAMRVQRGRHEIKIMVRLPRQDRKSLADFRNLRIRTVDPTTGQLVARPITELAEISIGRGPSAINRIDRQRSITVYADVDESIANTSDIVRGLKGLGGGGLVSLFAPAEAEEAPDRSLSSLLEDFPGVRVLWKGQAQQRGEAYTSMVVGMLCAIIGMFALLTIEFKSYIQPLLILMIIPFGLVGAVLGHGVMGIPISFFSMMGMVALTGIVVNDSIVMVDFINLKLAEGHNLTEAIQLSGTRRLRPVVLNSMTGCVGLVPMLLETSFQAQILVPMATAICFGLTMTTGLVLFLLPAVYSAYGRIVGIDEVDFKHAEEDHEEETSQRALSAQV